MKEFNFYELYEIVPKIKYDPQNPEHAKYKNKDESLLPAKISLDVNRERFIPAEERQRTNGGICVTNKGRIYYTYFTSHEHQREDSGTYVHICTSDDNGKSFQSRLIVDPPTLNVMLIDMFMMVDEMGWVRVFYTQGYSYDGRMGVWTSVCKNPDDDEPVFSTPERIANGTCPQAPIITDNGDWLMPAYLWDPRVSTEWRANKWWLNHLPDDWGTHIYKSSDKGKTWEKITEKSVQWAFSNFDETKIAELSDGTLKMMIRGMNCIGESYSYDGGRKWKIPHQNRGIFQFPDTKFALYKLKNGHLMIVANYRANMYSYYVGRNNLTAMISKDDGKTWEGFLMIDEREGSEQPEIFEGTNGFIYVSYGRAPTIAGESLLAIITEEDILAGKIVNPESKLRILAGKSEGMKKMDNYGEVVEIAKKYSIEL